LTPTADDDSRALRTLRVRRGTGRLLHREGWAWVAEFPLASGHRADLLAVDARGRILLVEIKSCLADLRADGKWPAYRAWCDLFAFAVPEDFPRAALPAETGVVVSDGFEAEWLRPPPERRLAPARRRALLLAFARTAAYRLARLSEPDPATGTAPASQHSIR